MPKLIQTIQGPKKFTISPHTKAGDIISFRGKKFECTHRRETLTSAGKPGVAFEFVAACNVCGIRYGQGVGPFGRLNKTCSNPECRAQAHSSNGRPAKKGGYLEWDGGPIELGKTVGVVQGKARERVAEATAVRLGHLGVYEAVHFSIPCDQCLLPFSQAVVATPGSNKWVRTVCFACEPKSGEKKAKSALGKPITEQKQPVTAPKPVAKRAEVINAVVEKAQMAPARPAPAVPVQPQKLPEYELAQAWQRLKEASERLNVQPKLGYLKSDHMEVRKILATRGPGLPALLNPLVQGVLAELDKLTAAGV